MGATGGIDPSTSIASTTTGVKVRSTAGSAAGADNKVANESAHTHNFTSGFQSTNHTHSLNFTTDTGTGGGLAHNNLPPALIVNKIVVAE